MKDRVYHIETIEKCNRFLEGCRKHGWQLWQMQYSFDHPEGFHAWFYKSREPDIEVITHNEDVQKAIISFN